MSQNSLPETGQKAPDFQLPDADGVPVSLADFAGRWLVLYFYPKDNTSGCTAEALDFTAHEADFRALGAAVIGVSPDSCQSHRKFIDGKKLKVQLLSDPDHRVLEAYRVWQKKKMYGREYMGVVRSTFIIDPQGVIRHVWPKVKVKGHVEEVLAKLRELPEQV